MESMKTYWEKFIKWNYHNKEFQAEDDNDVYVLSKYI